MQQIKFGKTSNISYYASEAYKNLRTNLQLCGSDVKVIAVTSCIPDEGKTSTALNLAKSISETGKRVLVIDADMRKSVSVGRYRISGGNYGLSHFLSESVSLNDVISETDIPNLYMILAGPFPPNPAELLGKDLFKAMIKVAREKFDYVIVDTPPIGSVIDSAVISQCCDGIAIVIGSGNVSYRFAQNAIEQLKKTNIRILGVILNMVNKGMDGSGRYYGKYYGRYYGKYYGKYYGRYYGNGQNDKGGNK